MQRIDSRFRLVLLLGFFAAALVVVGAVADLRWLTVSATAVLLSAVLLALGLLRASQNRMREDQAQLRDAIRSVRGAVRREVARGCDVDRNGTADLVSVESARLAERLLGEFDLMARQSAAELEELLTRATAQVLDQSQAGHSLHSRLRPTAAISRVEGTGPNLRQLLDLMDVVRRSGVRSTLAVSLGDGVVWLGYQVATNHGSAVTVVADDETRDRFIRELQQHRLDDVVSVLTAPMIEATVPHHYRPWHDVSSIPESATGFELVLAGPPPGGMWSLLPLVPLLAGRLAPRAAVAVATGRTPDALSVFDAWEASHGTQIDDTLSTLDVTVLRLP